MAKLTTETAKSPKGTPLNRLIKEISRSLCENNSHSHIGVTLQQMSQQLSSEGKQRPPELVRFDDKASQLLSDLFPGIAMSLNVPMPTLSELLYNSDIKILEAKQISPRPFHSIGEGARRCIYMALIRYLADQASNPIYQRTLLLIDEPESYLPPQAIEQVRAALAHLATNGYQVIFTTHAQAMLHYDYAAHTVMMYRAKHCALARKPLISAWTKFNHDNPQQSYLTYRLTKISALFFMERVILVSKQDEASLLPLFYEKMRGSSFIARSIGIIDIDDPEDIISVFHLLNAAGIPTKIVADLKFAFIYAKIASKPYLSEQQRQQIQQWFVSLARDKAVTLGKDGFPRADQGARAFANDGWAVFARYAAAQLMIQHLCQRFRADGIWLWQKGSFAHTLNMSENTSKNWWVTEQLIANSTATELSSQYAVLDELLTWLEA